MMKLYLIGEPESLRLQAEVFEYLLLDFKSAERRAGGSVGHRKDEHGIAKTTSEAFMWIKAITAFFD